MRGGMDGQIGKCAASLPGDARLKALPAAALEGRLTDGQAEQLATLDPTLVKLVLLAAARRIAEQDARIAELKGRLDAAGEVDPATPSGQRPIYARPAAPKRKGKPGASKGHRPARRPRPQRIDRREDHRLDVCPDCGGTLQRCRGSRTRTIEDMLEDLRTIVTEHTIHRDYCPACKRHVEPTVPDALPSTAVITPRVVRLRPSGRRWRTECPPAGAAERSGSNTSPRRGLR